MQNLRNTLWMLVMAIPLSSSSRAAEYSEFAENGDANIEDHSGSDYNLIQNEITGEGEYAFHLATGSGHWFAWLQDITPRPGMRLFFLSRLGIATGSQVAKVQVSQDGGRTWPDTVLEQAGRDGAGEGIFFLRDIDLASYVGETIRVRFLFDNSGAAFPDTTQDFGWYVDSIQVGYDFEKSLFDFGDPSDSEQHYIELINLARKDALAEAHRLRNSANHT